MSKILIIDDVFLYQLSLGEIMRELDGKSEITHVSSLHDGEAVLKAVNFDLVIVDIQIQGYTVIDMIDFIGRFSNSSRILIFSLAGYSSPKYATIPPKVRHLFLGKVRHQAGSKVADFGVLQCEFSEFRIPGKGRFLSKVRHLFLPKVRH